MRVFLIAVAALSLCGCAEKRLDELGYAERTALANEIVARCRKMTDGSDAQVRQCGMAEVDAERARRARNERTRRAVGMALAGFGDDMQRSAIANRPVTTTCSRSGSFINCNSY